MPHTASHGRVPTLRGKGCRRERKRQSHVCIGLSLDGVCKVSEKDHVLLVLHCNFSLSHHHSVCATGKDLRKKKPRV